MTREDIVKMVKSKMTEDLKYYTLDKLSCSPTYVQGIINRIGRIAFDNDYELTVDEQKDMLAEIFSNK